MRTNPAKLLFLGLLLVAFSNCKKDKDNTNNAVYNLSGNANGDQEAPNKVTTAATATLTGTYNKDNNTLTYTITWTGLEGGVPTAMHFHGAAPAGTAAGVQVGITGFPATTSGTVSGTANLSDAQETDLVNGQWYYNIHDAAHPAGEIRGQVALTQ